MEPSEEIRKIWEEMKLLKKFREIGAESLLINNVDGERLEEKYEEIETLFGHESTLNKAIIYYLDHQQEKPQGNDVY